MFQAFHQKATPTGQAWAREAPPVLQHLVSALLRTKLEVALCGLDSSGKSSLAFSITAPEREELPHILPTIGVVVQHTRHRGIGLTLWDLGGQRRFRFDWARHSSGCGCLLFVVDCSDGDRYADARMALHRLLEDPGMRGMPLLIIVSKVDLLPNSELAVREQQSWADLSRALNLDCITENRWSILGVSAKDGTNLEKLRRWLTLQAHEPKARVHSTKRSGFARSLGLGIMCRGRAYGERGFTLLSMMSEEPAETD